MGSSRTQDTDQLIRALEAGLRRFPEIAAAYLFGSVARKTDGPLSDVDIGVLLFNRPKGLDQLLEFTAEAAEIVGPKRAQVVILNDATVDLCYRVIRDGVVIFSRDERLRIEHWVKTVLVYLDMEPFRKTIAAGLEHRLAEGRFGRP